MRRTRKGWLLPPMLGMLLGLLLALTPLLAPAQPVVGGGELQVFVREGCPHCAAAMVGIAVLALSSNRLTEGTGRWLKLISGVVMVALALLLLLRPGWLF